MSKSGKSKPASMKISPGWAEGSVLIPPRVFRSIYPLSYALGFRPVSVNGNEHEGFDIDGVEKKLGADRFKSLQAGLKEVFCHQNGRLRVGG
jgi:hypothetical protein